MQVGGDDKLGMQVIPLKLLSPHEPKVFTLDLVNSLDLKDHHNRKRRGKLVVELTFDPFKYGSDSFKGLEDESNSVGNGSGDESVSGAGALLVSIIAAKDVEGENHTNPFVQVLFRGERRKTKTIKKNRNPRWNEHFEFMIEEVPLHEKLRVEIFSKKRTFGFQRKCAK
ncbi:hypothetical protein RND81_07G069000 [Saponaria officinalis]|uniref:C2 domain-containing protein n=1 Tax=Saponaria officinalis TaxID=3572 RepID=A0AAW1JPT0_SAPOF